MSLVINSTSIIGMLIIATIVAIGSYDRQKRYFVAAIYSSAIWLFIQYIVQMFSLSGAIGLKLIQLTSAISFLMAIFLYAFARFYANKPIPKSMFLLCLLSFAGVLVLNASGLLIRSAWGEQAGIVISDATPLYEIYMLGVGLIFASAIYQFVTYTRNATSKKDKARGLLLVFGLSQAVILLFVANVFFQLSASAQAIMPISLLIMTIAFGFAIVKYQFFDIRAAVIRTFAYALSLLTLASIYYALAYLISIFIFHGDMSMTVSVSPINALMALVLSFAFQPIKKFFDRVTNKYFYKDGYNSDDFFAQLNKTLGSTIDLRGLLERAALKISDILKSDQVFFYINIDDGHYITAGTPRHKLLSKEDAEQLSEVKRTMGDLIIASILEDPDPIRRLMLSYKIELILPLIKDKKTIGFLCLGDRLTSNYTNKDLRVLSAISSALIIAIQNALAVQEIREFNTTLQQRVANATKELRASNAMLRQLDKAKDEFVGMASHQLRTPLTSVKGYISMVLDGDAGEVNDSQKQLLNEAFNSSERMVRLINDFLNVSRLQTGKFVIEKHPVDLSKIVQQEIDSLQSSAIAHNMKFDYKAPENFPEMNVDEGKIRQVVMNFADNAIYYSRENSKVHVDLSVEGHNAIFKVKDNGIGVPVSEQKNLFTKFFRATNAKLQRPDGTGIGLYLAKKIIVDHGGKIIFESKEGEGSTFGFSLPIE